MDALEEMLASPIRGTMVAIAVDPDGPLAGVLLRGPSGAGKSDLALRAIEACPWRRTRLIADDMVHIRAHGARLMVSCPRTIKGLMEVRGIGILPFDHADEVVLRLVFDLGGVTRRLPQLARERLLASSPVSIPVLPLDPFEPSAPQKIRLCARACLDPARHNPEALIYQVPSGQAE